MRIALYAHGGSANHGCEALVRSAIKVLGSSHHYTLFSENPQEDERYDLDELAEIRATKSSIPATGIASLLYKIKHKISHSDIVYYKYLYRKILNQGDNFQLALAIGGDNYCYSGFKERFSVQNEIWRKHNIPIGLWGCSIDPDRINASMVKDLRKYQFITARESITYEALKSHSLDNVYLIPDTAFLLDSTEKDFPDVFQAHNTVGINISPLVIRQEVKSGIVMKNLELLIEYILNSTDMSVALIPHVVWINNDDREPLSQLYQKYKPSGMVVLLSDDNAAVLKGYIKRCRFLIAARTHASIAGYSSGIPTLVIGYSVKSKGIATDVFKTDKGYVIPIQSIDEDDVMSNSFKWLQSKEKDIVKRYADYLPTYYQSYNIIKELINRYGQ